MSPLRHDDRLTAVWVVEWFAGEGTYERLGDARRIADKLGTRVGAAVPGCDSQRLIAAGADIVIELDQPDAGPNAFLRATLDALKSHPVRVVICGDDPDNRALAARLAARAGMRLVSPALMLSARGQDLHVTELDFAGRRARRVVVPSDERVVVTIRDGVAEKLVPDPSREGTVFAKPASPVREPVIRRERLPVDPRTADIRYVRRLVCGGRGVGGVEGFQTLGRVAGKLEAGLAASRVAVDLGWVEQARQIGQTGKTVRPEVYIGCGVSGASHHLEGMSDSQHIIAINSDPEAPLVKRAHLALVADLHQVLDHLERALDAR